PAASVVRPAEPPGAVSAIVLVWVVPSASVRRISYVPANNPLVCQVKRYWPPTDSRPRLLVEAGVKGFPATPLTTGATCNDATALRLVIGLPLKSVSWNLMGMVRFRANDSPVLMGGRKPVQP